MTTEQVTEEFIKFTEDNDRGQGCAYIPWAWWVANVLLPRENTLMLESVLASLNAYPGGGGDERVMKEVDLIVWEKRAFDNQFTKEFPNDSARA